MSAQVQSKAQKFKDHKESEAAAETKQAEDHDTKVKDAGTARRNITRKKSGAAEGNYDNRNKKQGGHGKGKWSELNDGTLDEYVGSLNENDPMYDETVEGRYILSGGGDEEEPTFIDAEGKPIYGPMLTLPEFKIRLAESIREYFDSADSDEVIRSIEELKCRAFHAEVVKKAVSLSLDEGPRERELISRLLTCLHPTPLSEEDMEEGFGLILTGLDELLIDCPDAMVSLISLFLLHMFFVGCLTLHLSPWLVLSLLVQLLMKFCLLHICPPKTTTVQGIPLLKRLYPFSLGSIAQLVWNVSGVLVMAGLWQNSRLFLISFSRST